MPFTPPITPTPSTDGGSGSSGGSGSGWSFVGWISGLFAKADDKTASSDSSARNNYNTKTCTLKVTYYANGATGNPPSPFSQTYSGKLQPVTMSTEVKDNDTGMSKGNGYYFLGWATSSRGAVVYNPGDKITKEWTEKQKGTTKYDLYAVWTNHSIFIYKPDEHTKETRYNYSEKPLNQQTFIKGAIFHRTGYTHVGWATSAGGEKVYDLDQAFISTSDEVITLYPVWLVNTYSITLYPNGASGDPIQYSVDYGDEIELPLEPYTKSGYHISVWNESADGSDGSWVPGGIYEYTKESSTKLYAIWVGNEYYVIYDDGTRSSSNLQVGGPLYSSLLLDNDNCLYSEYLRITDDDLLYLVHPGYASTEIDDSVSAPYSIATYGSPFFTERRPYPEDKVYYSFDGWKADDDVILTKQNAHFDAYSYTSNPIWLQQRDMVLTPRWSPNYPFGKIFFKDRYSDDYGIVVEEPPAYVWPEHAYDHQKVSGKNGDVLLDPSRFENVVKKYKIAAYDGANFYSVASKVSEWLHRGYLDKYVRLEDSYEPDIYMMAVYEESNELENLLAEAGRCEISFNCKPQRFLISGDKRINIAYSGKKIVNPTNYPACPLITFNGAGTIRVNGVEIVVYDNYNTITFDAESYNAVDYIGRNMNAFIYTLNPIRLNPGANVITFEGDIYNLSIIPRWWKV